jgi:ribose/xylose/arabinose/galactoside ABC-type transport system permease subunit
MTVVIISAGIDLSAGSLVALTTVVTALLLKAAGDGIAGFLLPLAAALGGVSVCALAGLFNGVIISSLRIVPFIVTLGTMQIARGIAKGLSGQTPVNAPKTWLSGLMTVEPRMGVWYSVAPAVWVLIVLLIVMFVVLRHTVFGRHVYAVGSNEATARLCGIDVRAHRVWVYTICGALTGVAGVMAFSALNLGDPTGGIGLELDIIAAVVIGGGSLSGGEGRVTGSVIGALIIAILRSGCQAVGVENFVQNIVIGSIIIIAVGIDQIKRSRG